jgi:hypothetical protein
MNRRERLVNRAAGVLLLAFAVLTPTAAREAPLSTRAAPESIPDLASLPMDRVHFDGINERLTIEIPVGDVAGAGGLGGGAGMYMHSAPVSQAIVPTSGTIYAISTEIVDGAGRLLPRALLHHVNLMDPTRRELFLPVSLHIFAASKETPPVGVPRYLLGVPLAASQRLLVTAMVGNETATAYYDVSVRIVMRYRPATGLLPLWRAYPWVMDVTYPLGSGADANKAFDLPPGTTVRSWEASPVVAGHIVGLGGHVHDYATAVTLTDITTGRTLWQGVPQRDSAGHVLLLPVTRFYNWHSLGVRIEPAHRYRVSVTYYNPTGHLLRRGGMGNVAGLFIPDEPARWPAVDTTDAVYRQDLASFFVPPSDDMEGMMMKGGG